MTRQRPSNKEWQELLDEYWEAKDTNSPTSLIVLAGKYGVTPAAISYRLSTKGRRMPVDRWPEIYKEYQRGARPVDLAKKYLWEYDTLLKRIRKHERPGP